MTNKIKDLISATEEKELYALLLRAMIQHIEAKTSALLNKYEKGGIEHEKSDISGKQNEYLRGDDKHVHMPKSKQGIEVSIITDDISHFTTELPEIPKKGDKIFKGSSLTGFTVNHTVFVLDKQNTLEKIEVYAYS